MRGKNPEALAKAMRENLKKRKQQQREREVVKDEGRKDAPLSSDSAQDEKPQK